MFIKTAVVKIIKAIISQKMIKRRLIKDMIDFLQMLDKLSCKKRRQIKKNKQKTSIIETS